MRLKWWEFFFYHVKFCVGSVLGNICKLCHSSSCFLEKFVCVLIRSFKDTVAWLSIMFGLNNQPKLFYLQHYIFYQWLPILVIWIIIIITLNLFTSLALSIVRIGQNVMSMEILFFKLDLYTFNLHLLFTKAFKIYHVKTICRKGQK